jgi:Ca2+-binding RTX toxin-like protein
MANDTLFGGQGNDVAYGGQGDDLVYGNTGSDIIVGNHGNDTLYGNDGDDTLIGGAGNDVMVGGDGADKFRVLLSDNGTTLSGNDTISDFSAAKGDLIQVEANSVTAVASDASGNAVITLTNGGTITLTGVSSSEFSVSLFEVVSAQSGQALNDGASPFSPTYSPPTSPPTTSTVEVGGRASEPLVQVEAVGVPPHDPYHFYGDGVGDD